MSGRARRKLIAMRARLANRATRPLLNGKEASRDGTPSCSHIAATGPDLLKPQTSTAASSCSTKYFARMSACRSAPPSSRLNNTKTMRRPLRVEPEAGVSGGSTFFCKRGTHLLQNAPRSRVPKSVRVDDLPIVDRDTQLAETAPHHFHFNSVFFFQLCFHPGSDRLLRGSNRTRANDYFSHNKTSSCQGHRLPRLHVRMFEQHHSDERQRRAANAEC